MPKTAAYALAVVALLVGFFLGNIFHSAFWNMIFFSGKMLVLGLIVIILATLAFMAYRRIRGRSHA